MAQDENKNLDWKEYEVVTKYVYEMLGARYGIKAIGAIKSREVLALSMKLMC